MYFILTVATTVGFGDISPFTLSELVFCIFLMLFGAVINSIIVSEVIAVLTRVDQANTELHTKRTAISGFLESTNVRHSKLEDLLRKVADYSIREKYLRPHVHKVLVGTGAGTL